MEKRGNAGSVPRDISVAQHSYLQFKRDDEDDGGAEEGTNPMAAPFANTEGEDCDGEDDNSDYGGCSTESEMTSTTSTTSSTPTASVSRMLPPSTTTIFNSMVKSTTSTTPAASSTTSTTAPLTLTFVKVTLTRSTTVAASPPSALQDQNPMSTASNIQSFVATIIEPSSTSSISSFSAVPVSASTIGLSSDWAPSAAAQGISSAAPPSYSGKEAGIIVGVFGVFVVLASIVYFTRRSLRHRKQPREGIVGSSPLSSPLYRAPYSEGRRSEYVPKVQQVRSLNPSHNTSTNDAPTVPTGEIFPASAAQIVAPSPGLRSHPIRGSIQLADGSTQTIIKPIPFMTAKEITISSKKPTPKVQTTDLYVKEETGKPFPSEFSTKLNQSPAPLTFDMVAKDENGKSEKKTLLLEHKPGGRWSDPFTVAQRASGEAIESGTRWKSALSWVKDQSGRLNAGDKEGKPAAEVGKSMAEL